MLKIDLSGKTAIVTGGNIGIGAAISRHLAAYGARVALTYYSHQDAGEQTVKEIEAADGQAAAYHLDVADSAMVNEMIPRMAADLGGKIDILVTNAGHLIGRSSIAEMSDEHWHKVIDVNLSSTFYCVRTAIPLIRDGGRIVTMASISARHGGGHGSTAYAASKAGIITLTRGLAKELAPRNITVNALAPGFIINTPLQEELTGVENYGKIIDIIPMKLAGVPDDVAGSVLYFVSDLAAYVTGQTAEINGGLWFV
jgi:3-oxoacyl-[acyl-carrier protein] reductase